MAGLIKAIYALKHGQLPPTLHIETPNRHLRLESSRSFYLNDRLRNWPQTKNPRRAGLSSFGLGGTNVHVVLEEPPGRDFGFSIFGFWIAAAAGLCTDALQRHTPEALRRLASYLGRLNDDAQVGLGSLCLAAAWGATPQRRRLSLVARSRDQLADKLQLFLHLPEQAQTEGSLIFQAPPGSRDPWLKRRP